MKKNNKPQYRHKYKVTWIDKKREHDFLATIIFANDDDHAKRLAVRLPDTDITHESEIFDLERLS